MKNSKSPVLTINTTNGSSTLELNLANDEIYKRKATALVRLQIYNRKNRILALLAKDLFKSKKLSDNQAQTEGDGSEVVAIKDAMQKKAIQLFEAEWRELAADSFEILITEKVVIAPSIKEILKEKYLILGLIDKGASADVLLAEDLLTGEMVALKVMNFHDKLSKPKTFAQELEYLSRLSHENIVKVDADKSFHNKEGGFIVMEWIDGLCLNDRINRGRTYSLKEAIQIVLAVLSVLKYLKSINIVHGDIKPANIIKDIRNRIIILDFGITKNLDEEDKEEAEICSGTPLFMAPEMINDGIHLNSDIYNLGATLFYLLTGQNQHSGSDILSILREKNEGLYLTFDNVQYPASDLLKFLYKRMMEQQPGDRMDLDVQITGFEMLAGSYDPSYDREFIPPKKIPGHSKDTIDDTTRFSPASREKAIKIMEEHKSMLAQLLKENEPSDTDPAKADTETSARINQEE